jgi:hypothetical protein
MESESVLQQNMLPDDIHHSIVDADDMEEVWDETISVGDVFRNLLHHPAQLITRWNWKSAFMGAIVRSSFYFTVYVASRESWLVTLTAVLVEMTFRFITNGIAGAAVQSFRRATPPWLATVVISITLPIITHIIEFSTHYIQEKYYADIFAASEHSSRQKTFAISVLFSVVSAIFNLYLMRRGVMLVGAGKETQTLGNDLKKVPSLAYEFTIYLPDLLARSVGDGKLLYALGVLFSFGFTVGTILGLARGKWNWGYRSALGAWGILLFMTIMSALIRRIRYGRIST